MDVYFADLHSHLRIHLRLLPTCMEMLWSRRGICRFAYTAFISISTVCFQGPYAGERPYHRRRRWRRRTRRGKTPGSCFRKAMFALFFPTCQVRVVRFYQSSPPPPPPRLARPPAPPAPPPPPPPVSPRPVCINFHLHFRLANSLPSSSPTSELSAHRWTSTWDLPSSVGTAGPQPGTFPAQWAPLDLNLGPSQLSAHRWTSPWDLPSSVCTAGPQPGTCPAQCAPLDLNGQIECQKICQIECQIECQKICQIKCREICQIECQKICQIKC